jgi:phosphoglycolate phosphatase-like HAD superfamily hydrolase
MKEIIAVDGDDVLFQTIPALVGWHNEKYGTKLTIAHFTSYHFWEVWGGTREQAIDKWMLFIFSRWQKQVRPMPGAYEILKRWQEEGKTLILVTARQTEAIAIAEALTLLHYPGIFTDIISTNAYGRIGEAVRKIDVCTNLNAHMIIEDNLEYLDDFIGGSTLPVLFGRYPWNNYSRDRFIHHANWYTLGSDKRLFPK